MGEELGDDMGRMSANSGGMGGACWGGVPLEGTWALEVCCALLWVVKHSPLWRDLIGLNKFQDFGAEEQIQLHMGHSLHLQTHRQQLCLLYSS